VPSETRPVSDDRDTAEACTEHPSCIRGFIARPKYGYLNAAGWWHLEWDQADELWHATDPGGEAIDVQVRGEEKLTPPVALIGAFRYVPFHVVVEAIRRKGLFPPGPASRSPLPRPGLDHRRNWLGYERLDPALLRSSWKGWSLAGEPEGCIYSDHAADLAFVPSARQGQAPWAQI